MRLLVPLAALALLAGCNDGPCGLEPNTLDGSIGETLPDPPGIRVDSIRLKKPSSNTVTVEYLYGNDIVAKISADTHGFKKGAAIPLSNARAVQRFTSPESQFPNELERGQITFESDLAGGQTVSGCFAAIFKADDGSKRSLSGAFEGTLEDLTQ
jgi:hypothetical protein